MTAAELVQKHIDVAKNYKTVYMWGVFGAPVTEAIISEKAKQYPSWYTSSKIAELRKLIGKGYFGFDCVNLTKGLLWGWNGNKNAYYGGASYALKGSIPDVSADGAIALCKDVSTDFASVAVGEAIWMRGHWGVYIGDGLAVECTPIWKNGVQITAVGNIGAKSGYQTRTWTKHGKMPWVDYTGAKTEVNKNATIIINGKSYPIDRLMVGGRNYFAIREIVAVLNEAGVAKIEVGNKGDIAVLTTK